MNADNSLADEVIRNYISRYTASNRAAATVRALLEQTGIGLRPVVDHLSIRTHDVQERTREFTSLGYMYDDTIGVIERDSWWAKVFRRPGAPPIYIEQTLQGNRGSDSPITAWVDKFGDGLLHHLAIGVDRMEPAIERLQQEGIAFAGEISGIHGSEFRQIYTEPEIVDAEAFTVLELVERRWGFTGFLSPGPPLPH